MHGFAVIFVKVQIHTQLQNTFLNTGVEPYEGLSVKKTVRRTVFSEER